MPFRQARVGENEALFREINETVAAAAASAGAVIDPIEFLCECGRASCADGIQVNRDDYERVRRHSAEFLITPGHDRPEIEHVVEQHDHYWVVEKFGEAGRTARQTDPRST